MKRAKQVTAKDIALAVGVSRQAVSAVLSGSNPGCVSAAVREKIVNEAARVGYRPNTSALRLGGHKTRQIGLLLGGYGFALGFPTMLAQSIRQLGYRPVLMIANDAAEADDAAAELHSGAYDGIFIGTRTSWQHDDFRVPVVIQEYGNCDISMDLVAAGAMAAEHMLRQGYNKLIFLSMIPNWTVEKKYAGVVETAGCAIKHITVDQEPDLAQSILSELNYAERTGFICTDDILAVRLINFLRSQAVDIPGRAGVIGYGGYHYGNLVTPTLTTLVYPVEQLATAAAELLIDKVKKNICGVIDEVLTFVPQLKVGGSTSRNVLTDNLSDWEKKLYIRNDIKKKEVT